MKFYCLELNTRATTCNSNLVTSCSIFSCQYKTVAPLLNEHIHDQCSSFSSTKEIFSHNLSSIVPNMRYSDEHIALEPQPSDEEDFSISPTSTVKRSLDTVGFSDGGSSFTITAETNDLHVLGLSTTLMIA